MGAMGVVGGFTGCVDAVELLFVMLSDANRTSQGVRFRIANAWRARRKHAYLLAVHPLLCRTIRSSLKFRHRKLDASVRIAPHRRVPPRFQLPDFSLCNWRAALESGYDH